MPHGRTQHLPVSAFSDAADVTKRDANRLISIPWQNERILAVSRRPASSLTCMGAGGRWSRLPHVVSAARCRRAQARRIAIIDSRRVRFVARRAGSSVSAGQSRSASACRTRTQWPCCGSSASSSSRAISSMRPRKSSSAERAGIRSRRALSFHCPDFQSRDRGPPAPPACACS